MKKNCGKNPDFFKRKAVQLFPFLVRWSFKIKMRRTQFRLNKRKLKDQLIQSVKNAGPALLKGLKNQIGKLREGLGEMLSAFGSFSLIKKLAFLSLLLATGVSGYILYRASTNKLIPPDEELFVGSMADWAQQKYFYDPANEVESFFESTRTSQNILLMQKMTVNLRRSSESGPNPMGAFEFYVEGAASEVVVEIKDREPEMEDLFSRTIEDMTFDQVASGEGKKLCVTVFAKSSTKFLPKDMFAGFLLRLRLSNLKLCNVDIVVLQAIMQSAFRHTQILRGSALIAMIGRKTFDDHLSFNFFDHWSRLIGSFAFIEQGAINKFFNVIFCDVLTWIQSRRTTDQIF